MEKYINKWLEKGLISGKKAAELLEDYKLESQKIAKIRMQIFLYFVGAVLLGMGLISFIAANQWILDFLSKSPIIRITFATIVTFSLFYGGCYITYQKQSYPKMGQALMFLSTLAFGATIALIGQSYHENADTYGLYLIWMLCILPVAYLFKMPSVNIICVVLFYITLFFYANQYLNEDLFLLIIILTSTPLYMLGNLLKGYDKFALAYKTIATTFIYLTILAYAFLENWVTRLNDTNNTLAIICGILLLGNIAMAIVFNKDKQKTAEQIVLTLISVMLLAISYNNYFYVWYLSHTCLIAMILAGMLFGYKTNSPRQISMFSKFLIIYIVCLYSDFAWSFFSKTAFFLTGGVVLFGSAYLLEKQKKIFLGDNK